MNYDDDINAFADLGWGPDHLDKLGTLPVGAFAQFRALDDDTRALVIRLLDSPSDDDFRELNQLPHGKALAQWLLTLPRYRDAPDDEDDPR